MSSDVHLLSWLAMHGGLLTLLMLLPAIPGLAWLLGRVGESGTNRRAVIWWAAASLGSLASLGAVLVGTPDGAATTWLTWGLAGGGWLGALAGSGVAMRLLVASLDRTTTSALRRLAPLWPAMVTVGPALACGAVAAVRPGAAVSVVCGGLGAAMVAQLGFMASLLAVLQQAHRRTQALWRDEVERRGAAERDSIQLRESLTRREALAQRDALATERAQLLRVMAHEVRQPLHGTNAALQAVRQQLTADGPGDRQRLLRDMDRAEQTLATVRDVMDNVLAATQLMNAAAPLRPPRSDLGFLIHMTVLDLPDALRCRVRLPAAGMPLTLPLEPNLFRLALRNLLRNAFQHAPPSAPRTGMADVVISVSHAADRELGVVVRDHGPGLSEPALKARLAASAAWPAPFDSSPGRGLGLGLQIAHRVALLHGGRLELSAASPAGLEATLWFPCEAGQT